MHSLDSPSYSDAPVAVYVHVPFCARRCGYCDFATAALPADAAVAEERRALYLGALHAELDADPPRPARTVYFGGGTPTQLAAAQLLGILDHLRARGGLLPDAEITCEANPTSAEAGKFEALRAGGVSRLSLGIQSLTPELLTALDRNHSVEQALAAVRLARAAGFDNLSLDLMFNLPGQSVDGWRRTLDAILALAPEHLSLYSLTVEHGTPLAAQVAAGAVRLPDEETDATMFETAIETLVAAGYEHYEISNFARPGRRSRHNQVYWHNEEYRGYGPGAASYVGRERWLNVRTLEQYVRLSAAGESLRTEVDPRDADGEQRDTMYLGLRLLEGVDSEAYARRFGARPDDLFGAELSRLSERGLVELRAGRWRLTPTGLMLANQVFMEFV